MKRVLGFIVLILAVLLLSELLLVDFVEEKIADNLQANFNFRELDIEIKAWPAVKILAGRFDTFHLEAGGMKSPDMVEIESLLLDFSDINIDLSSLLFNGELAFSSIVNDELLLILKEDAVNDYFQQTATGLEGFSFRFLPEEVLLRTRIRIMEREIAAGLGGRFDLIHEGAGIDGGEIAARYVVDRIHIEEINLPGFLFESFVEDLDLYLIIELLPLPLQIEGIAVEEDRLVIYGP